MPKPPIVERLIHQLKGQGHDVGSATAIAISQLRKSGVLVNKRGTIKLTAKGKKRQSMTAGERAISRYRKQIKFKDRKIKYNKKTNTARLV